MKIYFTSLSTSTESIDAFLTVLVLMILEVNGNDIKEFYPELRGKILLSNDLLKQHGIYKQVTKYFNKFLLTKKISHEDAVELGSILRGARASFDRDVSIDHERLEFLKACAQNLYNDSDAAWNKIEKNVRILNNPALTAIFTTEDDIEIEGMTFKEAAAKIKPLVRKLTNKTDEYFLTPKEAQAARAAHPEVFAEYAKYAKILNRSVKHEIFRFVRKQKTPLVSIDLIRSHLEGLGMPNNLPRGFTGGLMDESGKAYTAEGRMLDKVPFGTVVMNPKYNPELDNTYVLSGVNHFARYRTTTFLSGNKAARHSLVQDFLKAEDEHVAKWRVDLNKKGSEDQILAAMVELLYKTSARIGGKGNQTAGEPTYGLSTLQVGHLRILPTKIVFDYTGKKGTNQYTEYKLNDAISKKVAEIIKELVAGKDKTAAVFTYRRHLITRQMVSAYLKSLGIQLTPHKFRQIAGTKLALAILAKAPFKKNSFLKQSAVERWFKEEALKIGEALHHRNGEKVTSATAIRSYIDPAPIADYFESLGLRRPKWLPK